MGRDLVFARYISDQSHRLQNAVRSSECRVRRLRRILHRHPIASRRIIEAIATVTIFLSLFLLLFLFGLSPAGLRLRCRGRGRTVWMGVRAVDRARLESVCAE